MTAIWYRYDYRRYSAGFDECGDALPGTIVRVELTEFIVERETPKGVWLRWKIGISGYTSSERRFVLHNARKKFACPTKEEAKASFIARKKAEIRIHSGRIEIAQAALKLIERDALTTYIFVR